MLRVPVLDEQLVDLLRHFRRPIEPFYMYVHLVSLVVRSLQVLEKEKKGYWLTHVTVYTVIVPVLSGQVIQKHTLHLKHVSWVEFNFS